MPALYFAGGFIILLLYASLSLPFLFIFNSAAYTDLTVLNVETELPIRFLGSRRQGDDDFMYYQFELLPEKPLTLVAVIISNERNSKSFKYFEADYNIVSIWGNPLDDSVDLLLEPTDDSQSFVELNSKTLLLTHSTLESHYWRKESEQVVEHFHEDDLNVQFLFEEGTANVHYKFFDREIMRRFPFR